MSTQADAREFDAAGSSRLSGWKEISAHLGRGVRTAQRWEKTLGMPVHRIGGEQGEIVFAYGDELDSWLARERASGSLLCEPGRPEPAEDDEALATRDERAGSRAVSGGSHPGPSRHQAARRSRWLGLAGVVVACAAGLAWWTGGRLAPPHAVVAMGSPGAMLSSAPVSWTLADGRLTVFDADGRELFRHALGFALTGSFSDRDHDRLRSPVHFADLDGDGHDEVLMAPPSVDPANARLHCFDARGRLRFEYQSRATVRFGETAYAAAWPVRHVFVTRRAAGTRSLWVVSQQPNRFPSSLQELDPSGRVLREYWANGRISHVAESRWREQDVLLVGAADEDKHGGSLAIFDRDDVGGSAPARRPGFDCTSCPLGGPREYLVFPRSCLADGETPVEEAWIEPGDRLSVTVAQSSVRLGGDDRGSRGGLTYYTFDAGLALVQAEISREFQLAHVALEGSGVLDHPFGARDDAALFPVLLFDGAGYRPLPAVPVGH